MAAQLGKDAKVYVSAAGSVWTEVGCINSVELTLGYNSADISQLGDATERTTPSTGTFSGSMSGYNDPADAGQVIINTALSPTAPTNLYIKVEHASGKGYSNLCSLEPAKIGMSQGADAQSFSVSFKAAGGVATTVVG
jgi:hypothetical protein